MKGNAVVYTAVLTHSRKREHGRGTKKALERSPFVRRLCVVLRSADDLNDTGADIWNLHAGPS